MSPHWFRSVARHRRSLRDMLPSSASAAAAAAVVAALGYQMFPLSPESKQRDVECNSSSLLLYNNAYCEAAPQPQAPPASDAGNAAPNQWTSGASYDPHSNEMPNNNPLPKHRLHPHVGMKDDEPGEFHGLFPKRQLWQPKVPYPLWDRNWDGRDLPTTGNKEMDREQARFVRKHGVTRHIILVRHGQYDEDEKEDDKRKLTELGRVQAELTGKRLREMIDAVVASHNSNDDDDAVAKATFSCRVKALRVSDMTRAKETASIIASFLPLEGGSSSDEVNNNTGLVTYPAPDPYLNEGRPCHHIPGVRATPKVIEVTDDNHRRIEEAFQKYFYRADPPTPLPVPTSKPSEVVEAAADHKQPSDSNSPDPSLAIVPPAPLNLTEGAGAESLRPQQQVMGTSSADPQPPAAAAVTQSVQDHHEFEIIVCHANVIRYFVCRSLQLPPEAWLRFCPFNCSLTYLTIRPTGSVSCRLLGDIGHIPYRLTSFSKHLGYNW